MIDHIGFPVSDFERSKAFYLKALAPLDYGLVMEMMQDRPPGEAPAAGFGAKGKPDFWIGGEGGLDKPLHVAIVAKDRAVVDAFYKAAIAAGGRDNGAPGIFAPIIMPTITAPSCSTPTDTTSRPCATSRSDPAPIFAAQGMYKGNIAIPTPLSISATCARSPITFPCSSLPQGDNMYVDLKPSPEWAMNGAHATHCMNEMKSVFRW